MRTPATPFKGEPRLPIGMCGANHGPSQSPANHATSQPASESTSKVRPRIAPTKAESASRPSMAMSTQARSGHATAGVTG